MFDSILFDCVCDGFSFGEAFYFFDADSGCVVGGGENVGYQYSI